MMQCMYGLGGEKSDGDSPTTYDRQRRIDEKLNYYIYMYINRTTVCKTDCI